MHEKVRDGCRFRRARVTGHCGGIEFGGIGVETRARLNQVAHHQADQQRNRGDDFEIEQGLAADAPHLFQVSHASNAGHDGAKDDQRDDHGDDADKGVPERLHGDGRVRPLPAQNDADRYADEHLAPESSIEGLFAGIRAAGCRFSIMHSHS